MTTPLRWAFPRSYRRLKELAQEAGVHEFEYRARVTRGADLVVTVTIERDGSEWSRSLSVADLDIGGADATVFFAETVKEMIVVGQATYQEFMHHREV
ncbi:hypothetical protein [Sulfobacillus harzensis]|uniref:Uncharacterized protein n=1 Tax=Sulfobacillus harzensis TaxID=2729629 RepID=A0A7Y0Q4F8_9FIRM|nr:hypothetical protein [Sulfobacillus harzensis]NMP23971.1 hypothetical protein [Sulfobacillus harzensis]